jgi:hypothetical protein
VPRRSDSMNPTPATRCDRKRRHWLLFLCLVSIPWAGQTRFRQDAEGQTSNAVSVVGVTRTSEPDDSVSLTTNEEMETRFFTTDPYCLESLRQTQRLFQSMEEDRERILRRIGHIQPTPQKCHLSFEEWFESVVMEKLPEQPQGAYLRFDTNALLIRGRLTADGFWAFDKVMRWDNTPLDDPPMFRRLWTLPKALYRGQTNQPSATIGSPKDTR